jgi:RNA polymerase sigma-70 factor (ECF subfamily)
MIDDSKLALRAARGDDRAFEKIVEKYERTVFNVALRIVKDEDDAADVAQLVFVKAHRKLSTYNPQYKFFSWLYRITVNECINTLRKRKREVLVDCDFKAGGGTAWDALAQDERGESLAHALMGLKLDYRIVIVLKYFLELSCSEISDIVRVPEKTVKSRLFTARHQLRDILIRQGYAR